MRGLAGWKELVVALPIASSAKSSFVLMLFPYHLLRDLFQAPSRFATHQPKLSMRLLFGNSMTSEMGYGTIRFTSPGAALDGYPPM